MKKVALAFHLLFANGIWWSTLALLELLPGKLSAYFLRMRTRRETTHQLPGFNTVRYNRYIWEKYDWSRGGEEWTESSEWKTALFRQIIEKNILPGKVVLEIGPGAGRWSVLLAGIARKLILVDVTQPCLDVCRRKLTHFANCIFVRNNGCDLPSIEDSSVDYIWSFDVFVHIAPDDVAEYLSEFERVLAPGGKALIHHSIQGSSKEGFRSSLTRNSLAQLLRANNLVALEEIVSWTYQEQVFTLEEGDVISVISKS